MSLSMLLDLHVNLHVMKQIRTVRAYSNQYCKVKSSTLCSAPNLVLPWFLFAYYNYQHLSVLLEYFLNSEKGLYACILVVSMHMCVYPFNLVTNV